MRTISISVDVDVEVRNGWQLLDDDGATSKRNRLTIIREKVLRAKRDTKQHRNKKTYFNVNWNGFSSTSTLARHLRLNLKYLWDKLFSSLSLCFTYVSSGRDLMLSTSPSIHCKHWRLKASRSKLKNRPRPPQISAHDLNSTRINFKLPRTFSALKNLIKQRNGSTGSFCMKIFMNSWKRFFGLLNFLCDAR